LEEIEAEKCWKLKRIEGLSCLKRLNCLKISTDDGIFWEDVCKFLKSPSSDGLSNFILTGKVDDAMDKGEMPREMFQLESDFYLQRVNIVSNTKTQDYHELPWMEFVNSHGAILWFITNDVGRCSFRVNFYDKRGKHSAHECITHGGERGGRRLHVFMWTRYSKLFKDFGHRVDISVGCSCDASASEWDKVLTEKGWLLMVNNRMEVLDICNQIIRDFAPKSPWSFVLLSH
jgi:hypothetical protein